MKYLRFCKKCTNVFTSQTKFGRVCPKCKVAHGGDYKPTGKSLTSILDNRSWYAREKSKT